MTGTISPTTIVPIILLTRPCNLLYLLYNEIKLNGNRSIWESCTAEVLKNRLELINLAFVPVIIQFGLISNILIQAFVVKCMIMMAERISCKSFKIFRDKAELCF